MKAYNNLLNTIFKVLMANFWVTTIGFIGSFIFPKILSIASYAFYQEFMLYSSYIVILHLGFPSGMVINYAGKDYKTTDKSQYKIEIFLVLALLVFFSMISVGIASLSQSKIWIYITLAIVPVVLVSIYKSLYQAWGRFKSFTRLNVFVSTLVPVLAILYYYRTKNLTGDVYVSIYLLVYWIAALIIICEFFVMTKGVKTGRLFSNKNWVTEKGGLALIIGNFINVLLVSVDKQFVRMFFSIEQFAYYSFGISMQSIMTVFITSIAQPLYPSMAKGELKKSDYNKMKELLMIFGSISGCAYFAVSFIVRNFIAKYISALDIVGVYFMVFPALAIINCLYLNLYKIERKMVTYIKSLFTVFTISLLLNICAVNWITQYVGVAIATTLTYYIWLYVGSKHFEDVKFFARDIIFLGVYLVGFFFITKIDNDITGFFIYLSFDIALVFICYGKHIGDYLVFYKKK